MTSADGATDSHVPVLVAEVLAALGDDTLQLVIDGTFGRGGHARLILERLAQNGRYLAIDRDPTALVAARYLQAQDSRVTPINGNAGDMAALVRALDIAPGSADAVLLDLGVSSPQLDEPLRGFSFQRNGPLDMRMDPTQGETAAQWIARTEEQAMADAFYLFGDERYSRRIARAIVAQRSVREIADTAELAELIADAHPAWPKARHPATKVFQAIRMVVNDEPGELVRALQAAVQELKPGGRLLVIAFHSFEDRIVKRFIRDARPQKNSNKRSEHEAAIPEVLRSVPDRQKSASQAQFQARSPVPLRAVGKPRKATALEASGNPRARSAILRVAERVA